MRAAPPCAPPRPAVAPPAGEEVRHEGVTLERRFARGESRRRAAGEEAEKVTREERATEKKRR